MRPYGILVPNQPVCGHIGQSGPVAQQIEQGFPKAEVAGAIPAGVTPAQKLRRAAKAAPSDRTWLAIQARLEQIQAWVQMGVPRDVAYQADMKLALARKLPLSRRVAAAEAIADWMWSKRAGAGA